MDHLCPVCQRQLRKELKTKHTEYDCFPPKSDHHYVRREALDGQLLKMKIRIGSDKDRLYIKINFDEGFSQVWTDPDDDEARIKINHVFEPDLTDLEALRQKIRTYMVFS